MRSAVWTLPFIVGGLAANVQMAINEQTKRAKTLFISVSQSDEPARAVTPRAPEQPYTIRRMHADESEQVLLDLEAEHFLGILDGL